MARRDRPRSRQKQEIAFRKSLLRFFIIFGVVLFCGLSTRVLIASIPLQEKIASQLDSPEGYELEVNEAYFQFHSGWIPVVAIHVPRIELSDKNCASNSLKIQSFLVVFDFLKMIQGKFEPGRIEVKLLEGSHYQVCEASRETVAKNDIDSPKGKKKAERKQRSQEKEGDLFQTEKVQNFYKNLWPEIKKIPVRKIAIAEVRWNEYIDVNEKLFMAGKFEAKKEQELKIKFAVDQLSYKGADLDSLYTSGRLLVNDEEISLELKNKIREGRFQVKSRLQRKKDWPLSISFDMNRLPVSAFSELLDSDMKLSYLWASCSGRLESPWQKAKEKDWEFGLCELNGPYGEIQIKNWQASFKDQRQFEIEVNKLDLDEIMKEKRDLLFSGVLAEFGILSGQVLLKDKLYKIKGHLENSQILFSNNNLRDVQKLKKLPFEIQGRPKSWKAKINDVELEEGQFTGDIQMELEGEEEKAKGRIAIHQLLLNDRIYKLMLKSRPAQLRVYGKFEISEGEINEWSALLATPELKSDDYVFKNLKVKGEKRDQDTSQVQVNISEGYLKKETPFLKWVRPTHLDKDWQGENVEFRELSTRLTIFESRKVEWKRGYARLKNGWQLSSEGQRNRDRQVVAWLQWDRPEDGKYLRWDFKGPFFEGRWHPKTAWVRDWLQEHPQFVEEHADISLEPFSEETLPKSSSRPSKAPATKGA